MKLTSCLVTLASALSLGTVVQADIQDCGSQLMNVDVWNHTPIVLGKGFCVTMGGQLHATIAQSEVRFHLVVNGLPRQVGPPQPICIGSCAVGEHTFEFCFQFPSWPGLADKVVGLRLSSIDNSRRMRIFCKEESVKPQAGEMAKTGLRVQG
ncbi:MAG: hypothetical protein J3Q66DRAFT_436975 [Benniella sp.]|nr:MAG: hypothetical protein J3Q66DRAFT_436975 [Benniella sp.]